MSDGNGGGSCPFASPSSGLDQLQQQQHPLLLWFDLLDAKYDGPLMGYAYYWLSLGAYYLLLFACGWFVVQRFRHGRPWARARSFLSSAARKKGDGSDGAVGDRGMADLPLLLYKDSRDTRRLLSKTTVLRQPYVPSPWLGHRLGGHMQSFMFATWCPPADKKAVRRLISRQEDVTSSFDGGSFRVDWFDLSDESIPANAPVVFVLPGVVGQGTNVYVRHLAAHLSIKYGWRVVAKSWRGIGSRLTTRRPETWDHTALSDLRDAVRHVRAKVGADVPIMGAGFSFGGCLLTALVGSVPQEEHGLCGLVSISGLFDMPAMMKHIAEQYAYPYGFANTKVTISNYRKFKVLETLSEGDACGLDLSDEEVVANGEMIAAAAALIESRELQGPRRKTLDNATLATLPTTAPTDGSSSSPGSDGGGQVSFDNAGVKEDGSIRGQRSPVLSSPGRTGFVTMKEMAAMKDHRVFHQALTLPFTGDKTVEDYFERIAEIMSRNISSVKVPTLCLLAKDDPLCPPLAWKGAVERAVESEGIVVAITEHGGHCGWFDGLGAASWLDKAVGDFLACALETANEATERAPRDGDAVRS